MVKQLLSSYRTGGKRRRGSNLGGPPQLPFSRLQCGRRKAVRIFDASFSRLETATYVYMSHREKSPPYDMAEKSPTQPEIKGPQ